MRKRLTIYRRIVFALFATLTVVSAFISFYLFVNSASIPEFIYYNVLLVIQKKSPDTPRYNNVLQISVFFLAAYAIPQMIAGLTNIAHMKSSPIIGFISGLIGFIFSFFIIKYFENNFLSYLVTIICVVEMVLCVLVYFTFINTKIFVSEENYYNIGSNKETLLIYYAPDNLFKEYALKVADSLGSVVIQITTKDKTMIFEIIRSAFINKDIIADELEIDFSKFRNVHFIIPSIFGHMIGPMADFIKKNPKINSRRVYIEFVSSTLIFADSLINQYKQISTITPKEYIFTFIFASKTLIRKRFSGDQ